MISRRHLTMGGLATALSAFGLWHFFGKSRRATAASTKTFEVTKTPEEWRKILSPPQYRVLRDHGTEYPFSSPLDKLYDDGTYHCAGCDLALFDSSTKYNSRTGWPSFWKPIENAVGTSVDYVIGVPRTEVHCRRCGGHLGHVFEDGPKPTGLRYCMNGIAMTFVPRKKEDKQAAG